MQQQFYVRLVQYCTATSQQPYINIALERCNIATKCKVAATILQLCRNEVCCMGNAAWERYPFHAAARSSEMRTLDARDYYVVPSSI